MRGRQWLVVAAFIALFATGCATEPGYVGPVYPVEPIGPDPFFYGPDVYLYDGYPRYPYRYHHFDGGRYAGRGYAGRRFEGNGGWSGRNYPFPSANVGRPQGTWRGSASGGFHPSPAPAPPPARRGRGR